MKNILTIMKKEFLRFFKDRRLVLTMVLPGILIYVIYSFLGQGIFDKLGSVDENYNYTIYTVNMPSDFKTSLTATEKAELNEITFEEAENVKKDVAAQKKDLLVVFSGGFEAAYEAVKRGESSELPKADVYFNATRTEGEQAYALFTAAIAPFSQQVTPYFLLEPQDLASEKDLTGMMFSMIGPMLVLVFLFAGCISIAPESIAGEKERGTLSTMLVTPVKRSHIALGKVISLSVLSLMSGLCSFLGLILSLPKLMQGAGEGISASVYVFSDYAMLLGIILSSVLVIVALVSIVSTLAKSVKEAANMVGPLMIVVMLLGVSTMFASSGAGSPFLYLIPLYNSARAMSGIFSFAASSVGVVITIISNLIVAALLAVVLAKMFDNEKIMFNK